ncbi:MAG: hypothetical protein ACI9Y1_003250 [Lentisphaeria bacterium]|jgi:hypothetical protein
MNRQRPLLLLALIVYIVAPFFIAWVTDTNGHWYRPFIIWLAVIVMAYGVQRLTQ